MSGGEWRATTFGDRPAIDRQLFGRNADGPAEYLGSETFQLDECEVIYWRNDANGKRIAGPSKVRLVDVVRAAPDMREQVVTTARRAMHREAGRIISELKEGLALLEAGDYEKANEVLDDLGAWKPDELRRELAKVEAQVEAEDVGQKLSDAIARTMDDELINGRRER